MAEALVCKVCNKKDSSDKCSVCGIAICEDCKHVVQTEDMSASHRVKGMTTEQELDYWRAVTDRLRARQKTGQGKHGRSARRTA